VDLYKLSVKCCGNNNKKRQMTYRKKILFSIEMDYSLVTLLLNVVF